MSERWGTPVQIGSFLDGLSELLPQTSGSEQFANQLVNASTLLKLARRQHVELDPFHTLQVILLPLRKETIDEESRWYIRLSTLLETVAGYMERNMQVDDVTTRSLGPKAAEAIRAIPSFHGDPEVELEIDETRDKINSLRAIRFSSLPQ